MDYLAWVESILTSHPSSTKPVIISITNSNPVVLQSMVRCIQELRFKLRDTNPGKPEKSRIAIELNTSCPNIPNSPPSGYSFKLLLPLLQVLKNAFAQDMTLTIGLKLPPYVSRDQFTEVITTLQSLVISNPNETPKSAFAFLTCTNTLGNSLLFSNQTTTDSALTFAVPTVLGGVAGETLHPLALGNVFTFKQLLSSNEAITTGLGDVRIIGVGGVTSKEAVVRMRQAGADVVGCATLLGKEGVRAFEILSKTWAKTVVRQYSLNLTTFVFRFVKKRLFGENERGVEGLVQSSGWFGCKGFTGPRENSKGRQCEDTRVVKLDTRRLGVHETPDGEMPLGSCTTFCFKISKTSRNKNMMRYRSMVEV